MHLPAFRNASWSDLQAWVVSLVRGASHPDSGELVPTLATDRLYLPGAELAPAEPARGIGRLFGAQGLEAEELPHVQFALFPAEGRGSAGAFLETRGVDPLRHLGQPWAEELDRALLELGITKNEYGYVVGLEIDEARRAGDLTVAILRDVYRVPSAGDVRLEP